MFLGSHNVAAVIGVPVGVFGMIATVSLYFYELHGVEKCAHYIDRGVQLEDDLDVPGAFTNRPYQIFGVVSELLPATLIFPRASRAGCSSRSTTRARRCADWQPSPFSLLEPRSR